MSRLSLVLLVVFALGCGPKGPRTYPIEGAVTVDGTPVKMGDIRFVPLDGALGAEGGPIADGVFHLRSKAGKCRVEISALDISPQTKWVDGSPIAANFIPERYNTQSILTADVIAGANAPFKFELTTK